MLKKSYITFRNMKRCFFYQWVLLMRGFCQIKLEPDYYCCKVKFKFLQFMEIILLTSEFPMFREGFLVSFSLTKIEVTTR